MKADAAAPNLASMPDGGFASGSDGGSASGPEAWLSELRAGLAQRGVAGADAAEALAFYEEAIADRLEAGLAPAEALAELGSPADAAERIAADVPALERARRRWPSWLFTTVVVALAATAIFWVPFVLAALIVVVALVGAFIMVDAAFVLALPLGVYDVVRGVAAGEAAQSIFFDLGAMLAVAGVGLLFAPVTVRLVGLAVRGLLRAFDWAVGLVRRTPRVERGPWFGTSATLRTFDRVCLIGGGAMLAAGLIVAAGILAAHGWDISNLPGKEGWQIGSEG